MKKFSVWFLVPVLLVATVAFAEVDVTPVDTASFFAQVFALLGKLASWKTAVVGVVALGTVFFRTQWGTNLAGIWTLAVVYGLSALGMAIDALVNGGTLASIFANAAITGAALNSLNEVLKHVSELFKPKTT